MTISIIWRDGLPFVGRGRGLKAVADAERQFDSYNRRKTRARKNIVSRRINSVSKKG